MKTYNLDLSADWARVSTHTYVIVKPKALFDRFGYPQLNDGDSESMGTYVFVSNEGEVAAVFFRANDFLPVIFAFLKKRFWRSSDAVRMSVGALNRKQAFEFGAWLEKNVECRITNSLRD
jgi:hypothetical protein